MWRALKKTWKFLAEASGVVTSIGLLLPVFGWIIKLIQSSLIFGLIVGLVLLFSFGVLVYIGREKINLFLQKFQEAQMQDRIKDMEEERGANFNIETHIPDDKLIKLVKKLSDKKVSEWASDCSLKCFNLYIDKHSIGSTEIRFQICYRSKWKMEEICYYYPDESKTIEKLETYGERNMTPFYKIEHWEKAFKRAWKK